MSQVTPPRRPAVSNLPPRVKKMTEHEPLFALARANYKHSPAGKIDNVLYRQRFGLALETARLADRSLDHYIEIFTEKLEQRDPNYPEAQLKVKLVIEFGCGLGRLADLLASKNFILYTGIEQSEALLRAAKKNARNRDRFQSGDLLTYRPSRTFDAAIAIDLLQFLSPTDQLKAMTNLNRLLERDSKLLLRWAAGDNDVRVKESSTPEGVFQGWIFRASKGYIEQLLYATGFDLNYQIETVVVNDQKYYVVFARKGLNLTARS